ncbi:hypothetical protein COC69_12485 [Bacillus cereus]|uniref:Tetratricopeptide repeat protein n=1 Tax=Bacillus cereus TaxID=1396 RepID=A0A9X7GW40_BACCE|nr:RapH N-terminal domain-containing protein [Bacillus cereus]PGS79362.1 hypothetical protein COC69_12485 [Bacillus cereus]
MSIQVKENEKITQLLNTWYLEIRSQHLIKAQQLKTKIDKMIGNIEEDQNVLLYYSLLDFRFNVLIDNLSITPSSFKLIDSLSTETDAFLSYYYHFFKAIHATIITNNSEAREYYEKAEILLKHVPDELEKAEFYYRFANFYLHTYQPLSAIQYVSKAKEIFSQHLGYENNTAACDNIFGAACIDIKQFPQAEESFNSAISILHEKNEDTLILRVRNNLGFLYANQNLSTLAIHHLDEVTEKIPNHFKAYFLKAREHYKLGEVNIAEELIKRGLTICRQVDNQEYQHHFTILELLNKGVSANILEKTVLEIIPYFNKKQLFNYTQEYTEKLAVKFYQEDNHSKASHYFHLSHQVKKTFEKGAIK